MYLTINTHKKLLTLLISVLSISVFATEIQDISFSNGNWTFTNGATYDPSTEEVTIKGNTETYEYARLTVNLPPNTSNTYLSADIFLENIGLGSVAWYAPKLKISQVGGKSLKAENLSSPAQGSWYNTFVEAETDGYNQVVLEFGFQNATGTFIIKNPKVTDTEPVATPYSFPYTIPTNPVCTINLISNDTMPFNNDLLSTNSHFSWASKSWGDPEIANAIKEHFPMSNYRFPGGTVGNFYNWSTDGYHNDASTFDNRSRTNLYNNGFTFGYNGFKDLVIDSDGSATLMFNVIHDDITTATNRLQSRISDNLNVKWVELGNENFYSTQSYGYIAGNQWQVSDVDQYIAHTSSLVNSLKTVSPSTQFAVCVNHNDYSENGWSNRLASETYYDLTTVHNYNNVGSENLDFASGVVLLDSYKYTRKTITEHKTHFGNTPMIMTEWGVLGSNSFLGVLSTADMFLAILEGNTKDGVVMQAGIHMLYHSDANAPQTLLFMEGNQVKYSPVRAFYSKLYEVFKDQSIYTALSNSDEIDTKLPGVISRAIDLGDSIKIFSVNKLPVASKLQVNLDSKEVTGNYKIETYAMSPEMWPDAYNNPNDAWTTASTNNDQISIPSYSISIITLPKKPIVTTITNHTIENSIKIYPNPVFDKVYLDGVMINSKYTIVDVNGKIQLEGKYASEGINIENLNSGIYFLKVDNQMVKVVKE
ncbi:MAG: T9SS type A sorting domain-containing protein [Cytophagales bacterium]|nr:T9SS type A sorting domain-containing protein [Cytophagales bacterium]